MATRVPDNVKAAIADDLRATAGTTDGAIRRVADRHGVSTDTVRRVAAAAGVALTREITKKATEASLSDLAARRAKLAGELLAYAEETMERARQLRDGTYVAPVGIPDYALDWMPSVAQSLVTVGIALDKHKMLDQYDSEARGAAAVDLFLRAVAGEGPAAES